MSKYDVDIGQQFGDWTVIGYSSKKDNKQRYVKCQCKCGAIKDINLYSLIHKHTSQCKKCYNKSKSAIIGAKFGKLKPLYKINDKGKAKYHCVCDCGNTIDVFGCNLLKGLITSCGCVRKENGKKYYSEKLSPLLVENTNLYALSSKPTKASKTGYRGVTLLPNGQYKANITLNKKQYYLGCFWDLKEAVQARKAAEEKMFVPILEKYADLLNGKN